MKRNLTWSLSPPTSCPPRHTSACIPSLCMCSARQYAQSLYIRIPAQRASGIPDASRSESSDGGTRFSLPSSSSLCLPAREAGRIPNDYTLAATRTVSTSFVYVSPSITAVTVNLTLWPAMLFLKSAGENVQ